MNKYRNSSKFISVLMVLQRHLDKKPLQFAVVLAFVAGRPGISFQDTQALAGVSKASLSGVISWYVKMGYMVSHTLPNDGSSKVAFLTPKGEKFINQVWAALD